MTNGTGVWRLLVGLAGTLALVIVVAVVYYVFSLLVLYVGGRLLPLTGRRRRR